jgi:predicted XRE-type DNA-binding protein
MKTELIAQFEELLSKDAGEVANEVRALQKEYQKQWTLEFEKAKQAFVEEGGKAKEFEYPKQAEDIQFESLVDKYAKLKKESEAKQAGEQARNLLIKQEIVAKIKDLSHLSENVGAAIKKLQELQTQWKETGAVSTHKYKEVQADYSRAIEEFYYNLKIYRDLQEHDLKKNYELKAELVEKLKNLQALDNIKEAERLIKIYRNEWDEIGPVPGDKWEAIKQDYRTVLEATYAKLKAHYHAAEEQKGTNLQAKTELVEKAKAIVQSAENGNAAKWNQATEQLIALQAEWKTIGRTTEKDNEKVWGEFRGICDHFFEKKKDFFAVLNEKFSAARKIKNELIEKAEALQNSTDWQKTSMALIRLQEEWKKHSGQGDKEESRLYQKFRNACNVFFDAKKASQAGQEAEFENNLKVKEELIEKISQYVPGEDGNANRAQLKAFSAEWNAAGLVPVKDKKRINEAFYNKLDELYEKMQLAKEEKGMMQFRSKIDRLAAAENAIDLLGKESDYLKKQADEINNNIRTYDNNLGFFKHSKANPLKTEFENKIAAEKQKLEELTGKRKMVNEELKKLRESKKPQVEAN